MTREIMYQALPSLFHTASNEKLVGPGNKAICSHMTSHDMTNGHSSIHTDRTGLKVQTEKDVYVPDDHQFSCHWQPLGWI